MGPVSFRGTVDLEKLLEWASQVCGEMTPEEKEAQMVSWVYETCKLSNDNITREMVEEAVRERKDLCASSLKQSKSTSTSATRGQGETKP